MNKHLISKYVMSVVILVVFAWIVWTLVRDPLPVHPPPSVLPAYPSIALQSTDDYDPVEECLDEEDWDHAEAGSLPITPESFSEAIQEDRLPDLETVDLRQAGHLVLEQSSSEDQAEVAAHLLRQELAQAGYLDWANRATATRVYENGWVVRISSVSEVDARRACSWLYKHKSAHDHCLYTSDPVITISTEYMSIKP